MTRLISSVLVLFFVLVQSAFASDVCRLPSFDGMQENKARAIAVLSDVTTHDLAKTQVYVEYDGDILYYQSNFISAGKDEDGNPFRYPTKVKGSPAQEPAFANAQRVFKNIVFTSPPDPVETATMEKSLQDSVQFYVDVSVFDENGIPRVDLSGIKNIQIVDGKKGQTVAVQPELLTTSRPPPSLITKLKGCCLYGRPPHAASKLLDALGAQPLKVADVRFASMFIDSATETAVQNSRGVRTARLAGDGKKLRSKEDFAKLMSAAKGTTLVLVGHVEGNSYVIRDSGNRETFRIAIAEMRQLAQKNGVRLIDIGCETTKAIADATLGFGVITKYNSVASVRSINKALASAKTVEDFLVSLTSGGLKVVVEPSFANKAPMKQASIYSRIRARAQVLWAKVATVTFTGL